MLSPEPWDVQRLWLSVPPLSPRFTTTCTSQQKLTSLCTRQYFKYNYNILILESSDRTRFFRRDGWTCRGCGFQYRRTQQVSLPPVHPSRNWYRCVLVSISNLQHVFFYQNHASFISLAIREVHISRYNKNSSKKQKKLGIIKIALSVHG